MQDRTLSCQNAFPVFSELAVWADVSVDRDGFDAEFLRQLRDGGVAVGNCCQCEAYLRFGEGELPTAFATPCAGSFET